MKELNDEKLQQLLEKKLSADGLSAKEQEDFRIYQLLFDELGKKLPVTLSPGFASNLVNQLQAKKTRRYDFSYFLLLALFAVIVFAGIYIGIVIINNNIATQLLDVLMRYKWMLVFVIIYFIVFQVLDQKLVNKRRLTS